jgi:hypothetical protein
MEVGMEQGKLAVLLRRHGTGGAILLVGFAGTLGLMLAAPIYLPAGEASDRRAACDQADLAAVAALKPLMQRADQRATAATASAFRLIADARRSCWHNEPDRALELYSIASQAIAREQAGIASYKD